MTHEQIDLGAELADYTDAEHAALSREPAPAYVDMVQGVTVTGSPGPGPSWPLTADPPPWVITDPPHPNQMPIPPDAGAPPVLWTDGVYRPANAPPPSSPRCNQCRRYIPLPAGLFVAAECLYCDECADMRRRANDDPMPF